MSSDQSVIAGILHHCSNGHTSITPLIGHLASSGRLYRFKDKLIKSGLLETSGKDLYRTTPQGILRLEAITGDVPPGLTTIYPPLAQVPTLLHRATIELVIAAIIARRYDVRPDHHPTFTMAGQTFTWKSSTGTFICHMLGLDPNKQIINLAAEAGRSTWLRKNSTGKVTYKRELMDSPFVVFDEYQSADPETKRLHAIWTDGRKTIAVENQLLTISAVTLETLNPREGKTWQERLTLPSPQIRRRFICNVAGTKNSDLALTGDAILAAAKAHCPIDLPKPTADCTKHKPEIHEALRRSLNEEDTELVDLETITMLATAMTAYMGPLDAIRLVLFDALLLFESLGWTRPGWKVHVKSFPTIVADDVPEIISPDSGNIPQETLVKAFRHLKSGASSAELVTELGLTYEEAEQATKRYLAIRLKELEVEVQIAKLEHEKDVITAPMEASKELAELRLILEAGGKVKRMQCGFYNGEYCDVDGWKKKPETDHPVGEYVFKDDWWVVNPSPLSCVVCPDFVHRYYPTTVELEEKITEISQDLDNTKTIINNTVQNLREMTCTKCGAPTWRGWYPNQ
jgi:hypothetical protein